MLNKNSLLTSKIELWELRNQNDLCYDQTAWKLRSCQQILSRDWNNWIWLATWKYAEQILLKKWEYQNNFCSRLKSRLAHTAHSRSWGRETDERNIKWVVIWRKIKNQDSTKAEVRALVMPHYNLQLDIFFQSITKSTRKLTKSIDQRWIYDVNRMSTSKSKKVSETFGTEVL